MVPRIRSRTDPLRRRKAPSCLRPGRRCLRPIRRQLSANRPDRFSSKSKTMLRHCGFSNARPRRQDRAVEAAQKYLDLAITRYKGGVTKLPRSDHGSVRLAFPIRFTAVNLLGRRMVDSVLLMQALGGGWIALGCPERPECCGKLSAAK